MSLQFLIPSPEHKEIVLAYKAAFEAAGDSMDGTANLAKAESYEQWLGWVIQNGKEETVREGFVPATTFLAFEGDALVGFVDIRHRLNDYLVQVGGHIGYSVHPDHRRKGHASAMLAHALGYCKIELGLDRVLVTCDKGNTASHKTILKNGGVIENEVAIEDEVVLRHWIAL